MSRARTTVMAEKSLEAALAAIESYNKPDARYREESFVVLMVNAWELLIKAKLIKDSGNKLSAIYINENLSGKRPKYKLSRSGNKMTIDVLRCINLAIVDEKLRAQLLILVELRNDSIHFFTPTAKLRTKIFEVGVATLRSYARVQKSWFGIDIQKYNWYIIPVSFMHIDNSTIHVDGSDPKEIERVLALIGEAETKYPSNTRNRHNISLNVDLKVRQSKKVDSASVRFDKEGHVSVRRDAEDIFQGKYPWSYKDDLVPRLKGRYKETLFNKRFWGLLKECRSNVQYCGTRYLNPKSKKTPQHFYSPAALDFFDNHYSLVD